MIWAFVYFMRSLRKMPLYAQLWVALLAMANGIAPLFFSGRIEADVTLIIFLASVALMAVLTKNYGFTRILGAGHFLWFFLLIYLATRLDAVPAADAYGLWLRAVMIINAISLVIDVTDVVRYVRCDREEMV